jgi:2'-5' RNA ligase
MNSNHPAEAPQRLFFALWPDPALARRFHRLAEAQQALCKGRPVPVPNIHLTLRFVGSVPATTAGCLQEAAAGLRLPAFELVFDTLGYWPRPKVLWCAPAQFPEALNELARSLEQACVACGLEPERRDFAPHLTLLRHARRAPPEPDIPPLRWPVDHFVLARSETRPDGAVYSVLQSWPLGD